MEIKEVAVVGIPRCGTTYVFRSLAGLKQAGSSPKGKAMESLPIMKTHSLAPPESFNDPMAKQLADHVKSRRKVIFVFGDPILAVVSTIRKRLDHVHAANCGYFGILDRNLLLMKDAFHYERMFDSWMSTKSCPVACIRYESLEFIQRMGILEAFLGRDIKWLPLLPRNTAYATIDSVLSSKLDSVYGRLRKKIIDTADVSIRNI